jgi:rod shape-determining protein MreC
MPANPRIIRRIVLVVLLAASLGLTTVYFREGDAGALHGAQRSLGQTFAPAEGGIQRVAQPLRDAIGWAGNVADAQSERDRLRRENARLRQQVADETDAEQKVGELEAELHYTQSREFLALSGYRPQVAHVVVRSPQLYAAKVLVDQGSAQGVAVDDPVLSGVSTADLKAGGSLVGRVTAVTSSTAEVTLLSDPSMAVAASVVGRNGANGVLEPNSGDRSTQILDFVRKSAEVAVHDQVVTSGFSDPSGKLPSYFPAGIPIGIVTFENQSDTDNYKTIQVTPWVDLLSFRTVLILTRGAR